MTRVSGWSRVPEPPASMIPFMGKSGSAADGEVEKWERKSGR